jgi:hypothetical protein
VESTTEAQSDVAEVKARITVPGRYYLFVNSPAATPARTPRIRF